MNEVEIAERLAALEQDKKAANHRLENLEKLTESVYSLAQSVKSMQEDLKNIMARVAKIKHNGTCRKDRGTPCQALGNLDSSYNYGAYIRSRWLYFIKNYRRVM